MAASRVIAGAAAGCYVAAACVIIAGSAIADPLAAEVPIEPVAPVGAPPDVGSSELDVLMRQLESDAEPLVAVAEQLALADPFVETLLHADYQLTDVEPVVAGAQLVGVGLHYEVGSVQSATFLLREPGGHGEHAENVAAGATAVHVAGFRQVLVVVDVERRTVTSVDALDGVRTLLDGAGLPVVAE